MGQYHKIANLDKREYIMPHSLGDGLKAWEQMNSHGGTIAALFALLVVSNGRGGGDLADPTNGEVIGRWGGDRVVVIGDYAEDSDFRTRPTDRLTPSQLYSACAQHEDDCDIPPSEHFTNISEAVKPILAANCRVAFDDSLHGGFVMRRSLDREPLTALKPDMVINIGKEDARG